MIWWDSFETLSKAQTILAILVSVIGLATLTVKLRADHLKKQIEVRRSQERARLDRELQEQTATALRATAELDARTRPKPFDERLRLFLNRVDKRLATALGQGKPIHVTSDLDTADATELRRLCSEPEAAQYVTLLTKETDLRFMSDGTTRTTLEYVLSTNLTNP